MKKHEKGHYFFIHAYIHCIRKSNGNMIIPRSAMSRPQTKHFPPVRAGMTEWDRILSMQWRKMQRRWRKNANLTLVTISIFFVRRKRCLIQPGVRWIPSSVSARCSSPGTSTYPPWNEAISQPGKNWENHRLKSAGWYGDMWISRRVRIYLFACSKREMM